MVWMVINQIRMQICTLAILVTLEAPNNMKLKMIIKEMNLGILKIKYILRPKIIIMADGMLILQSHLNQLKW